MKSLISPHLLALFLVLPIMTSASRADEPNSGEIDLSFDPETTIKGSIRAVAQQEDGKWIIGGDFSSIGNIARSGIARLNFDGTLDGTFGAGLAGAAYSRPEGATVSQAVFAVVLQNDGKILVGGRFTSFNDEPRGGVARLNPDGTLDSTFGHGLAGADGSGVTAIALQEDGKIFIGGTFSRVNGEQREWIARLNTDGTLDSGFEAAIHAPNTHGLPGGWGVSSLTIQEEGRILVAGGFTHVNGAIRNNIARLHSNGSLDTSFNPTATTNGRIESVGTQEDGKTVLGGWFTSVNGQSRHHLARLQPDGSLDPSFAEGLAGVGSGSSARVHSVLVQANQRILIGGEFGTVHGEARNRIARLQRDGALDGAFGEGMTGADHTVYAMGIQPDQRSIVAGNFSSVNDIFRSRIARLHSGNLAPTSIELSSASISENVAIGTAIGTLSAIDPDEGDLHTFTSVEGDGDEANELFAVDGPFLKTAALMDREERETHTIRVRATDQGGLFAERSFTVTVVSSPDDPSDLPPEDLQLSNNSVAENRPVGTEVGILSAVDASSEAGTHTFSLVRGEGDDGNNSFTIDGNVLKTAVVLDAEVQAQYTLRIRATNSRGLWVKRVVTIDVETNEPPTDILLSNDTVREGSPPGTEVGQLFAPDPNPQDEHTFALVPGEGDEGNALFSIDGGTLRTAGELDFASSSRHSIRVRATDLEGGSIDKILLIDVLAVPTGGQLHVDLSFDPGGDINGTVFAAARQNDGKWIIAGDFTGVHNAARRHVARLHADGSTDHSFLHGMSGASSEVRAVAQLEDGKILIAGGFYEINGHRRNRIARLHPDGSLDTAFANPLDENYGGIEALAVQPDGKIVIAGTFVDLDGRNRVARLNPDGSLDPTFTGGTAGPNQMVRAVALGADGRILIGGSFTSVEGEPRNGIARLNQDGSLDPTFGDGLDGADHIVYSVAVQTNGKILIGGTFVTVNGEARNRIARLNSDGTLDNSFGEAMSGTDGHVAAITVEDDDTIFIGGSFSSVNDEPRGHIARLNNDGSLNTTFGSGLAGANLWVDCIELDSDGRIFIGGRFGFVNGEARNRVAWLKSDGSLDEEVVRTRTGPSDPVNSVVAPPDGRIVIGGRFKSIHGETRIRVAQLHADGTLDPDFMNGLAGPPHAVDAVAVQPDGKVIIGGSFTSVHGETRYRIARLNTDGTLDSTFDEGLNPGTSVIHALALQWDGKILIGGGNRVARINPDGTIDSTFGEGLPGGVYGIAYAIALEADGSVLLGGDFTSVRGQPRSHLARLHPDGSLDETFASGPSAGANEPVRAIAVQDDGKIVIAGEFTTINDHSRNRIARLHQDGAVDTGFGHDLTGVEAPTPPGGVTRTPFVNALAIQADGRILLGGWFTRVNGEFRNHIARLRTDGTVDHGLGGTNNTVRSIAVQQDGNIVIAGDFSEVNGIPRTRLARLYGGPPSWDEAPANILLSNHRVQEHSPIGTTVGTFSAVDANPDDIHTFALVGGEGDEGNSFFTIDDDVLKTAAVFEHDTQTAYSIRVRATDLAGSTLEKNLTVTVERDRYEVWTENLPSGQRGESDDPGGHGLANLLRYGFAMDPLQPERDQLPRIGTQAVSPSGQRLTVTFIRRKDDIKLSYSIEGSEDLLSWSPLTRTTILHVTDDGTGETETVTVIDTQNIDDRARRFLRVRVER